MIIYYATMKIKTKRYYAYYLACVARFFIGILPLKFALGLGEVVGRIVFAIAKKERKNALINLRNSFPKKSDAEIERIAKAVFTNLCKNVIEWMGSYKLNKRNIDFWVKDEGFEKVRQVLLKGKGGIMLASHFGNWELISIYFLLKDCPGTVIARRIYFDRYDKFINRVRTSKGVGVIYRDESPKKILRVLKNGGLIGILADQDVDSVDGVFVDFFGKPAYTPKAPVAFSLASGAPLIPCFMIREKNRYRLIVEDPIVPIQRSTKEETIQYNTERWSRLIESYIRKYPEQWVWLHKRWKTRPDDLKARETSENHI